MPKIAFLFPGQGAQAVGMGRELDRDLPEARKLFDRAGEILGFDLRAACFDGPAEALEATDVSQPAIFVASLAVLEDLKAKQPDVVAGCAGAAGLSLGEYTALVFAGALDFETGLKVVRRRGEVMQAAAVATPSGMSSVLGLDEPAIDELCRRVAPHGRLWKANLLGKGNIVVSGEKSALEHLEPIATELGALGVIPLAVAGAFHSDLMKPADAQLAEVLAGAPIQPPRIPVYSNVDAAHHSDPDDLQRTLVAQVIGGVRWEESMRRMLADGFDTFYEIGPGRVLTGLLKRIDRKAPCTSIPRVEEACRLGTLTAIYVRVSDPAAMEALLAEYPGAYTEPGTPFFAVDNPPFGFSPPEDELQALSSRLDTDVLFLVFQSVVDAFEFHHWRQGARLRSLVFGCRGMHERTWERIEGEAEPWEEVALAGFEAPLEPGQFGALNARETAREVAIHYRLPGWGDDWADA